MDDANAPPKTAAPLAQPKCCRTVSSKILCDFAHVLDMPGEED